MKIRNKIFYSVGALALGLFPVAGFGLPDAAAVPVDTTSIVPSSGSIRQVTPSVPTKAGADKFIFDQDGDYLTPLQESVLAKIAQTTYQAAGHQLVYISTSDSSFDDDTSGWTDKFLAKHKEIGENHALFASGPNKYYYSIDGQTKDIIGDNWDGLIETVDEVDGDEFQVSQTFFSTFSSYLVSKPVDGAGVATPNQPEENTTPSEEPADNTQTPEPIESPTEATEFDDVIEFPDDDQVPFVGGQADVSSAAPFIRDHSGVFSESKLAGWEKRLADLAKKYGIAAYLVTVDDFQGQSAEQWGANYYNANQLGLDKTEANGVIMIINPTSRDLWFLGHGKGEKAFTVYGIERLYYHVKEPLGDDDWDGGVEVYLTQVADYLEQWQAGTPYSEDHPVPHRMTPTSTAIGATGATAIGVGTGTAVMRGLKRKHKTAKKQSGASYYVVPGSNQVTGSRDDFVNSYITKVTRPKEEKSYGFSGGSFSSGGTSFSSGGGKF